MNNKQMISKHFQYIASPKSEISESKESSSLHLWKMKLAIKQQQREFRKKIFGDHYNYSVVGLNKEKHFLKQEEKNTEIQRSNRILLEKIQRIAKRSVPNPIKQRQFTQEHEKADESEVIIKNMMKQSHRNQKKTMKSFNNLANKNIREEQISERSTQNKMILFKGKKQIQGITFNLNIFIENRKYTILAQKGRSQQKIQMNLEGYNVLLKECLEGNHLMIFSILHLNEQNALELKGIRKQINNIIENQQSKLPDPEQLDQDF